ncbi:MAG: hypothetical protein AAB433_05890, partial [Nitrospirota bacterium]
MTSSLTIAFLATCRMALRLIIIVLLIHAEPVRAQSSETGLQASLNALSTERMLADIRTLSAPSLNGRLAGSEDDVRSARWVAQELAVANLQLPPIMNGSLSFPFVSGKHGTPLGVMASIIPTSTIQPDPELRMGSADRMTVSSPGADYLPVFDSPSAHIQSRIIFVGYGIVDPARGIDDYAGVDVANHIVLFLRGKPDQYPKPVSHAGKVRLARDHGALGYLTATGPILNPYDARRGVTGKPSAFYGQLPPDQAIPGAWISTALAEQILSGSDNVKIDRLQLLQEQLNKAPASQSRETDRYVSLHWNTTIQEGLLT